MIIIIPLIIIIVKIITIISSPVLLAQQDKESRETARPPVDQIHLGIHHLGTHLLDDYLRLGHVGNKFNLCNASFEPQSIPIPIPSSLRSENEVTIVLLGHFAGSKNGVKSEMTALA